MLNSYFFVGKPRGGAIGWNTLLVIIRRSPLVIDRPKLAGELRLPNQPLCELRYRVAELRRKPPELFT